MSRLLLMYMNSFLENSIDKRNDEPQEILYGCNVQCLLSLQHAFCNFSENTSNHAGSFTKTGEKDSSAESKSDALSGLILGPC